MNTTGISLAPTSTANSTAVNSVSGNTTNVTTLADGETVTTVRSAKGAIISISTTPPTRPPQPGTGSTVNVTA